jgi:hypothetical protein
VRAKPTASSGLSNKFKTVDPDAVPAKTVGSQMMRTRQRAEKNFADRKATEYP